MNEITIPSRVINLHDTEANWKTKKDFIPKSGETIIYDADASYNHCRIKLGDGVTTINNLPFVSISETELNAIINNITTQIDQNELQVSETKPEFPCTWFRVTSTT